MKNKVAFFSLFLLNGSLINIAHAELLDNKHRADSVVKITCDFVYQNNKREPASQGTGVIISSLGHMLTAKHVLHPKEIPNGVSLECEGRRKSKNRPPIKLKIDEQTMLSMADAAIAIYDDGDFDDYVSLCNAKNLVGNHSNELTMLGFPLDLDLNEWKGKVTDFKGPNSTWHVDAGFKAGFSGGPVFNSDGYVIGISVGGPSDNSQGYRNILPEYTFRGMTTLISDTWCGKPIGDLINRVSDLEVKLNNPGLKTSKLSEESEWNSNISSLKLNMKVDDGYCFITKTWGVFNHERDRVSIEINDNKEFVLTGDSDGGGRHGGSARCIWF